jgi:hypothetical protein
VKKITFFFYLFLELAGGVNELERLKKKINDKSDKLMENVNQGGLN